MTSLSRRRFLHRLAAAGAITWLGGEGLSACGQHETPPATKPPRPTLTTVSVMATATATAETKEVPLPSPRTKGTLPLEEALVGRRRA